MQQHDARRGAGAGRGAHALRRARLPRHRHPAARRRGRALLGLALPLHGHQGGAARRDHAHQPDRAPRRGGARSRGRIPDPRERLVALVGSTCAPTPRRRSRPGWSTTRSTRCRAAARAEVVALRDRYEALWQDALEEGAAAGASRSGRRPSYAGRCWRCAAASPAGGRPPASSISTPWRGSTPPSRCDSSARRRPSARRLSLGDGASRTTRRRRSKFSRDLGTQTAVSDLQIRVSVQVIGRLTASAVRRPRCAVRSCRSWPADRRPSGRVGGWGANHASDLVRGGRSATARADAEGTRVP